MVVMNIATLLLLVLASAFSFTTVATQNAAGTSVMTSKRTPTDFTLTADPNAVQWKNVKGVIAERGPQGDLTPGHRTEARSLWTDKNLYFLFICPYQELYALPKLSTATETDKLWEADVAELFIGSDFQNIKRYYEFQVSPRAEWVDLFIDRNPMPPNHDVSWNSGFEVTAKIDSAKRVWYGAMRIPIAKIDTRASAAGNEMRMNFYRFQGPPNNRKRIAWQPTRTDSYHVPEAFGTLRLIQ
jgi:Carbohydrate family 9 binding domain-like